MTDWRSRAQPPKVSHIANYFTNHLKADIDSLKNYANRLTGFKNIDEQQFFSPGLYVIGATPAAGKTTFCWQLLEQLAQRGESCIFCSSFNISDARQKIDKAKKQQPRQIQLKCLKNRQGTNYNCFFKYFSAHDCFTPCEKFGDDDETSDNSSSNNKRNSRRV